MYRHITDSFKAWITTDSIKIVSTTFCTLVTAYCTCKINCRRVGFFFSKSAKKSVKRGVRVSPQSRSPFSASFHTFCLTARVYLNSQKYGLFFSLLIAKDTLRIVLCVTTFYLQHCAVACFVLKRWLVYDCTNFVAEKYDVVCYWKTVSLYCELINLNAGWRRV